MIKVLENEKIDVKNLEIGFTEFDIYLFHQGSHFEAYNFMGCHLREENGQTGARFTTWAPNAERVRVTGSFNNWNEACAFDMERVGSDGIWSFFIPNAKEGDIYKYIITSKRGKNVYKADPYATYSEVRPNTASVIKSKNNYNWKDDAWIKARKKNNTLKSPINVYEIHLGSWKRNSEGKFLTYRELARELPKYVKGMGYTHIEFMPIMEHPLDGSWGYQVTGYYSITSRFGTPEDFKFLVDSCHKEGLGVILDWVPGHFCKDEHGLYEFDGTPTYEYSDITKKENKGWGACNFDLSKTEVRSFLLSNANYWLKEFHVDGLRVDAVANMIYLDYCKNENEWIPNIEGGRENLEAMEFFKILNKEIHHKYENILMIAEESTAWSMITNKIEDGGLGFDLKWNMGWMNDSLEYIKVDSYDRNKHHNKMTFAMMYNHTENFMLSISHDEVVHGKKALVDKMWGDYFTKFSGFRAYLGYMYTHPGKKLLFMGNEFAQFIEWRFYEGLEWYLIDKFNMNRKAQEFVRELNTVYKREKALWQFERESEGFKWIDADNKGQSIYVYYRQGETKKDTIVVLCNFTVNTYRGYDIGVPYYGEYEEIINTDLDIFGGSNEFVNGKKNSIIKKCHNQDYTINIDIPPMSTLMFKLQKLKRGRRPSILTNSAEQKIDNEEIKE